MGNLVSYIYNKPDVYKKYGWIKDIPDQRDKYVVLNSNNNLNSKDLRDKFPGIYNQCNIGSCNANAIASIYEYIQINKNDKYFYTPSRLFIYYNERFLQNTTQFDSGSSISNSIRSLKKYGVCSEMDWQYTTENLKIKPNQKCYDIGKKNIINFNYIRLNQDLDQLKACICNNNPFIFGFSVYEGFEKKNFTETGIMNYPGIKEKLLGGHCVVAVGYDDTKEMFIIRNSMGINWGDKGYFYMPYHFITNPDMCSDFWFIQENA